uniref:Uncharacterized protein n=1 Tax=Tanacetum cinerariifolium TaxID=118510 RepID=A0A699IQR1_TANCI|nr:hypothetical protein [Tanacetum cinerariifolium]
MDMTIDQQVALDEALVPHASCLRIEKSNFRLRSDITYKESTLRLVYNVLRLNPFYKAFSVTSDTFDELPFEEEILAFLRYHGHSREIRKIIDVNINKLHQTCRSFTAVINKCLSGKSTGYDNFVYEDEHKDDKKSNEVYYPRFIKVIIHFFMTKDPLIPRRNKVNWHYVSDDQMFTTIKLVSRNQNTQQFGAILPIELTNEDIRNYAAYKEYYAIASGSAPPKTKASVRKTQISFDTIITPPMAAGTRLLTSVKGKQHAKSSKAKGLSVLSEVAMTEAEHMKLAIKRSLQQTHISQASGSGTDEETCILPGVLDVPTDESDEEISWKSRDEVDDDEVDDKSDDQEDEDDQDDNDDDDQDDNDDDQDTNNDGDDFLHPKLSIQKEEAKDEESFDPIVQTPKNSDDEGNNDASLGMNVGGEEGQNAEDDDEELYRDVNINLEGIDSLFESTPRVDVQASTTVAPLTLTAPTLPPLTIPIISQFVGAISSIPGIFERYIDQRMNEAVKVAIQIQSDRLRDEAQAENKEFLNKLDENIQKIIKEQVKEQVKIKMKNPSMDQTGGLREEEKEKSQSQKALQRKRQPRPLASLLKGPNLIKRLQANTLTPELLAGPTYELMKGSFNMESARDVYSKRRIIAVTKLQIIEWHNYKHLDWITVPRDDDKLYKFKEGDFKRLRIQDIKDMLLLLVQGKLTNLTVKERFAFNVSPRMFTRSIVIQRRVEDLQLGVESYQKKLVTFRIFRTFYVVI